MATMAETLRQIRTKLVGTGSITSGVETVRREITAKQEKLKAAARACVPLKEALARVAEVVAADGAAWLERFGAGFLRLPVNEEMARIHGLASPVSRGRAALPELAFAHGDFWGFLCVTDPKRAETMLATLLEQMRASGRYVEGSTSAERPALLARLEAELAELGAAEEQLVDEAADAGVTIEHRPEVQRRRRQAAERAKAAAEKRAELEARQARLDAKRSAARNAPRAERQSSYLSAVQAGE